jgi:hypothetical protein
VQTPLAFPPFDFTAALPSAALFFGAKVKFLFLLDFFLILSLFRPEIPALWPVPAVLCANPACA